MNLTVTILPDRIAFVEMTASTRRRCRRLFCGDAKVVATAW
jgi:hypothetical protein